jgi:hypothetical protein
MCLIGHHHFNMRIEDVRYIASPIISTPDGSVTLRKRRKYMPLLLEKFLGVVRA